MQFHIQTLLLLHTVLYLVQCGVLWISYHTNPKVKGIKTWMLAYALWGLSSYLILLRDLIHPGVSIVVANTIYLTSAFLNVLAVRRFLGMKNSGIVYFYFTALVLFVPGFIYFSVVSPNITVRTMLFSFSQALMFGAAARVMLTNADRHHIARYFYAGVTGLHALANVFRGFAIYFYPPESNLFSFSNPINQFALIELSVIVVLLTIAIILLVAEDLADYLRKLASYDSLTNAYNRRAFFEQFERALKIRDREQRPVSVIVADLDHFKKINDNNGHTIGDEALKHFVALTHSLIRPADALGRIGGEEFAIYLPHTNMEQAKVVAERIRQTCEQTPLICGGRTVIITTSLGVVEAHQDETSASIFKRADDNLYKAKRLGRNRVICQ